MIVRFKLSRMNPSVPVELRGAIGYMPWSYSTYRSTIPLFLYVRLFNEFSMRNLHFYTRFPRRFSFRNFPFSRVKVLNYILKLLAFCFGALLWRLNGQFWLGVYEGLHACRV